MNKKLKIACAAVSVVMAGTMAFGMFGCNSGGGGSGGGGSHQDATVAITGTMWNATPSTGATSFVDTLKTNYNLTARVNANAGGWTTANQYWSWLKTSVSEPSAEGPDSTYTSGTRIGIAIGHNSDTTGAFFGNIAETSVALPDGTNATSKGLKPAFKAIQSALDVTFSDGYLGASTSANLGKYLASGGNGKWGTNAADSVDVCTSDLSKAVGAAAGTALDLGQYLDQMPNFKAFLESNPIVYLSLLQDGMTENLEGKSIYCAPYFDGNDDIERYCMIRQDWVVDLLDKTLASDGDYYGDVCGTVAAKGWMGETGSYDIVTTLDATGATFTLKKDYDAAKAAAADEATPLGTAYKAIAGVAYDGTSGNIVDITNKALETGKNASGKQLVALYKAYIDVAYKNGTNKAYTKHSDVFNGYNAAWDVDDLVTMLRIVKTNSQNLGLESGTALGIFPREANNDRTPDIIRLASQLYGERGADSRYEYTYIDNEGNLQDMRANASFYQALENFGALAKEGLVVDYTSAAIDPNALKGNCDDLPGIGFMMYDYTQKPTAHAFDRDANDDYLLAPISTPVSRWDDNGDGSKDTIMRFTESWRSTKTSGLVVAGGVANDANKLKAVLAFIDYLYSNDGQILSTYGPQSTTGNTNPNGFWYGDEVTSAVVGENDIKVGGVTVATKIGGQMVVNEANQSKYFCFGNKLYTGVLYKGKMTPKITSALADSFTSTASGSVCATNTFKKCRGSFTDYARMVIGATLPMGVKDQSFENQMTAPSVAEHATKVSVSIANGTIKHPELTPTTNLWYTVVPTDLPKNQDQKDIIGNENQNNLKYMTGTKKGDSKNFYSIFHHIIFNGYTGTYNQQQVVVNFGN